MKTALCVDALLLAFGLILVLWPARKPAPAPGPVHQSAAEANALALLTKVSNVTRVARITAVYRPCNARWQDRSEADVFRDQCIAAFRATLSPEQLESLTRWPRRDPLDEPVPA